MVELIVVLIVVFIVGRWILYRIGALVFGGSKRSDCLQCRGAYRQPRRAIGPGNYVRDHSYSMYCPACGQKG